MVSSTSGAPFPSVLTPIVDKDGRVTPSWQSFFASLVSVPSAIEAIAVGASPFDYAASFPGTVLIVGGTVSAVALTRGRVSINPTGLIAGFFPVGLQDVLTVTWSGLPAMYFIPGRARIS